MFSIRYKFTLALLIFSISCLLSYAYLIKGVFESDKEAAIFESSSQSNKIMSEALNQHINEAIVQAQSLIYTIQNGQFTGVSEKMGSSYKDLLFIGLISNNEVKSFFTKTPDYPESFIKTLATQKSFMTPLNSPGYYAINIDINATEASKDNTRLIIGYSFSKQLENFSFSSKTGGCVFVMDGQSVGSMNAQSNDLLIRLIETAKFDDGKPEFAFFQNFNNQQFLSSYRSVGFPKMYIYTTIPKDMAYTGLYKLYDKSVLFFIIIVFLVLGSAVVMSSSLLKNLQQLTTATLEIAQGNFDARLEIKSGDEIGLLSKSFNHMSYEIKRLLFETREKARMESELITAQTIQKTLFPLNIYQDHKITLNGIYRSASECGGDWWYYFNHPTGFYVIIADATGHGVPAALITAAAKSAVSLLVANPELNLETLVKGLNLAIYETSQGEILMTGFIMHFDLNGQIHSINASHEPPAVVSPEGCEYVLTESNPRLGESLDSNFIVSPFPLPADSILYLYTDGITGQVNEKSREFGDRRLAKILNVGTDENAMQTTIATVFGEVDKYKGSVDQNDDLTMVALRVVA